MTTLGARLRAAREVAGLSQGELANRCGWGETPAQAQSRISLYERDKNEPTLDDIRKMGKVLKVDPATLAFGHPLEPDAEELKILLAYQQAGTTGKRLLRLTAESIVDHRAAAHKRRNAR